VFPVRRFPRRLKVGASARVPASPLHTSQIIPILILDDAVASPRGDTGHSIHRYEFHRLKDHDQTAWTFIFFSFGGVFSKVLHRTLDITGAPSRHIHIHIFTTHRT